MVRQFSAGGVVYRRQGAELLWLIRRPSPSEGYHGNLGWSFPKGMIDGGEKMEEAAMREVREEGGVEVKIVKKLPTLKVFFTDEKKEKIMKFISYFVMEYQGDAPEGFGWETAEVKWVTPGQAKELLAFKNEKKLLEQAGNIAE